VEHPCFNILIETPSARLGKPSSLRGVVCLDADSGPPRIGLAEQAAAGPLPHQKMRRGSAKFRQECQLSHSGKRYI
jgi:hypothetical protein